ncbi:MAG: hypothetical protein LBF94_03815 [Puniceicoccales bacterium]|jgi:hypothetical protein|nr:hypothetical protein [Puniceicoccales bacterium]
MSTNSNIKNDICSFLQKGLSFLSIAKPGTTVSFFSDNRTKINNAGQEIEMVIKSIDADKKMFKVTINKNDKATPGHGRDLQTRCVESSPIAFEKWYKGLDVCFPARFFKDGYILEVRANSSDNRLVQLSFAKSDNGSEKKPPLKEVTIDLSKGLDLGGVITDSVVGFFGRLMGNQSVSPVGNFKKLESLVSEIKKHLKL